MSHKRIRFIINPISGVGRQRTIETQVEQHLDASRFDAEMVYTEHAGHAIELAKKAAAEGIDIVVAVGGDGSVNEVGQGLCQTNSVMAIVPTGSGNGLARHFGMPVDVRKAIERINDGQVHEMDTVEMNGTTFLGVAGVGFDALIAKEFDSFGTRGLMSYVRLVLRELNTYQHQRYKIWVDGQLMERDAFVVLVANSSQYGNGAQIAPMASASDGQLDIGIVKPFPPVLRAEMVVRLFRGTLHKTRHTEYVQGTHVVIEQEADYAQMDGEPVDTGKRLEFTIKPLSLKVLV